MKTPDAPAALLLLHAGVPWNTTDDTLEQHFSRFGRVDEAQIMREKYTGKSRGFGFVTFGAPADAHRAVASEHEIDGRKCEAKFALPEGKVGSARTTRIFVARIPASVTDQQFRAYFEQVGPAGVACFCWVNCVVAVQWLGGSWRLVAGAGCVGHSAKGVACVLTRCLQLKLALLERSCGCCTALMACTCAR
jgi:hypothetical protein